MKESIREAGTKALALVVLLVAVYILFRVVLGVIAGVAWMLVGIIALVAVLWALNRIL